MNVPISKSNPKIQCQYVLLKTKTFFLKNKNKQKTKLEKEKQNKKKTKTEKGGKSPQTPTLYPCIVLNVFNMYKMQRKSMKSTYLLKVEGMREKLSSSHPSSCSTYLDFH